MELELLKLFEKHFNFHANLVDGKNDWGNVINGTWNGIVGQVANGASFTRVHLVETFHKFTN